MESDRFSFPEILIIFFGLLLFSVCTYMYAIDYKIGIFGNDRFGKLTPVGRLAQTRGDTKRKLDSESSFIRILPQTVLYNYDTIVTGPDNPATIQLDDGGSIELAPKTMIRLAFESTFGWSGISRSATVDVVSGEVKGNTQKTEIILKTKDSKVLIPKDTTASTKVASIPKPVFVPPPPPPAVVAPKVELISPQNGAKLSVERGSLIAQREVALDFKIIPPHSAVEVSLIKMSGRKEELFSKKLKSKEGTASLKAVIKHPGTYEWRVISASDIPLEKDISTQFSVEKTFTAIKILPPLFGGEAQSTSRIHSDEVKQDFDIRLRWEPFPDASEYTVSFYRNPADSNPIWQRRVNHHSMILNRDKVFDGRVYYRISSELKNGYIVQSDNVGFEFNFLPPVLVEPKPNHRFTQKDLTQSNQEIVLTWEKTHFTDEYEIEISRNPSFKESESNKLIRRSTPDNFFIFQSPKAGAYYWRVMSSSKELKSPPSPGQVFEVEPAAEAVEKPNRLR